MKFNKHTELKGLHAFLSPSGYHWVNYDTDRLIDRFKTDKAAKEGTELHALASSLINKKIKTRDLKQAFNQFVNDAIGFRMTSEQSLMYSEHCFGTADAISFDDKTKLLRIFDLKTGRGRVSFTQLDIYAALFCLEYGYNPEELIIEERIYQGPGYTINNPDPLTIRGIMRIIIDHTETLRDIVSKEE